MHLSVIIPTFNRSIQLNKTLESIARQSLSEKEYEIIIIDNGSTDDTADVITKFIATHANHQIRSFYDSTPGLLTGRHLGAEKSHGEVLVYADDDIKASEDWLKTIQEIFRNPNVQLAGGKCLPAYEIDPPNWILDFYTDFEMGKMLPDLSLCDFGNTVKEISPNYIWGLNFSIRKSALYELGGFHPDNITPAFQMFQGDGETGLALKAIERHYTCIYHPQNLVFHDVPQKRMTIDYFDKRYFYQGICDSFTQIRKNKGLLLIQQEKSIAQETVQFLRVIKNIIWKRGNQSILNLHLHDPDFLRLRLNRMHQAGYSFHQNAARHKIVYDWILKPDYFDYRLPELPTS
jgi:glycosyltransferase involved in cell wall biosynthesis